MQETLATQEKPATRKRKASRKQWRRDDLMWKAIFEDVFEEPQNDDYI